MTYIDFLWAKFLKVREIEELLIKGAAGSGETSCQGNVDGEQGDKSKLKSGY